MMIGGCINIIDIIAILFKMNKDYVFENYICN